MKKTGLIFILLFLSIIVYGQSFITPDEVKPGMKGYGLSVFKGWEPEKFDVEIIDIVKNYEPGGDMILARLSGAGLEKSGIIAGMSGSPVYIEGRLLGAVAFTWSFSKDPICGITPIGLMLNMKENTRTANRSASDGPARKISMPVSINGFAPEVQSFLKNLFDTNNCGLMLTGSGQSGGVNSNSTADLKSFKGGDAVSINLIDGDYSAQGVGTVTYVSNDDVYIFGHPMDLSGETALPVSRSYIYSIIPSSQLSFKIGSSSVPNGATVFDGQNAVYCKLNAPSEMVPVQVRIINESGVFNYRFRVADSQNYFPSLAAGAVSSSFLNHTGYLDDKRLTIDLRMDLEYAGKSLTVTNTLKYAFNPSYYSITAMLSDLSSYFGVFYDESYGKISIKNIAITIRIEKGIRYYVLDSLLLDQTTAEPGDTVNCKAVLKEFQGGYTNITLALKIPSTVKSGPYWIYVGSQTGVYSELMRFFPRYYSPSNVEDIIKLVNWQQNPFILTAGMMITQPGLIVRDKKLPRFPENYSQFFYRSGDKNTALFFPELTEISAGLNAAVFGIQRAGVTIQARQAEAME